jgi:uncharacterized protein (DUF1330 family)
MPKTYWVATYRAIHDADKFAAYAKLAGPALQAVPQRVVLIEFDSVAQARAAHDSPAYAEALRALGSAVDRDIRIVEGA